MAELSRRPPSWLATLRRRGPWLALALTALAVGAGGQRSLELERSAVLAGEWWRALSCHFVHYGPAHAFGDIAAFSVWAGIIEAVSRRLLVAVCLTAALVVSVGVLWLCPEVQHYAGLSAIDVALATTLLCVLAASSRFRSLPGARVLLYGIALVHVAKAVYELVIGSAILAPDLGEGVKLLPAAHLLGALAGVLAWYSLRRFEARGVEQARELFAQRAGPSVASARSQSSMTS